MQVRVAAALLFLFCYGESPAAAMTLECPPIFQRILGKTRLQSDDAIRDGVTLTGKFKLKNVSGHDDIFRGSLANGQPFIFRTGRERAKKEVAAYRFGKAAGFDVPQTVHAEINGIKGSVQRNVDGLPLASDLDMRNDWKSEGAQSANAATRVFDALLAMNDRNTSNFFVRSDGTQVLIDHEQMFYANRSVVILQDGNREAIDLRTIRNFVSMDPERARRLADIGEESNFIWALREMPPENVQEVRLRLQVYRRLYREATAPTK